VGVRLSVKVGDMVGSSDPYWDGEGIIIDIQEGRMGEDLNLREIRVWWYYTERIGPNNTWAMKKGLKVISGEAEESEE